ncbi:hypothetical protein DL1_16935 [Thioclava dalianensis]|uniref:Uncharacterized protein n=1 Tax=Thioclava dalianensis TaxID=1185766 RepID=A0A074TZU7_9RHOB|nr:GIY-YIG nuclease family protein [Thioclava dalianensis]KEP67952.1 hypothetical protein DL1_16935 [Thioclava dalianensis]SFN91996.1 hypothetical protein SAMN05216224_1262 [Thioclava dalianensis]
MTQHQPIILHIRGEDHVVQPGEIHAHWREAAEAKGYRIVARVKDRYSLALECNSCGGLHVSRLFVLLNYQPECPHCVDARRRETAKHAGLELLRRDHGNRKYAFYRASCGHEIRRQFELVERMAQGETAVRCEICHHAREQEEAALEGWELLGADPQGSRNYRLYRHAEGCGAEARIARANMQTGRFTCPGCGESWATGPSFLYAMKFKLETGSSAIKLGFSRNPDSRLKYQLHRHSDLARELLLKVPMRTGRHAQRVEKRLHKWLVAEFPDELVPPEEFSDLLRVKSELYRAGLEETILRQMHRIARKEKRAAERNRARSRSRSKRMRRT